jgi:predicted dienelactone hydrolase
MPLRFYVPKGEGPFPLILFVAGTGGGNDTFAPTSRFLASHGYVVLHNSYERQRGLANDELTRLRISGARYMLDSLGAITQRYPSLKGKIDFQSIGAMGHSSGAYITQLLGGAWVAWNGEVQSLREPRIKAIVLYSGQGRGQQGLTESSWRSLSVPMLVLTGTRDRGAFGQDPAWRRDPFDLSPPGNKYFAQYEGGHHGSYSGRFIRDPASRAIFEHAQVLTLVFWDAYLKGNADALAFLRSGSPRTMNAASLRYDWR